MKIKILHCLLSQNIGGIETFLINVLRRIDKNDFYIDFISECETPAYNDEIRSLGSNIYQLPPRRKHPLQHRKMLYKLIHENNYNIIHVHKNSLADISAFTVCKRARVKSVIAHSHSSSTLTKIFHLLHLVNRKKIRRIAKYYFACNELAGRWLFGNKLYNEGNITIVSNAIDIDRFAFCQKTRDNVRRALGLQDNFVIGHVGRFISNKNHEFLIKLFLIAHKINPSSVLMLVGEGEVKTKIEKLVLQNGISDSVIFTGERNDVSELYQAMDVFVLPSFYEGMPVAAIEAQAAGLPCLLSNSISNEIALTSLVKQLEMNNLDIWLDAIKNTKKIENRENCNKRIIEERYDISSTVSKLEQLYRSFAYD